jgi:hypothetical protein
MICLDEYSGKTTIHTSDNLPGSKGVANMYIGLGDLTKNQCDLDELHVHLVCDFAIARHDIQQGRRQRIEESFSDEHPAEVVFRSRTLQLEHAANTVQCMDDEFHLFGIVFIEKVNENLQSSTTIRV